MPSIAIDTARKHVQIPPNSQCLDQKDLSGAVHTQCALTQRVLCVLVAVEHTVAGEARPILTFCFLHMLSIYDKPNRAALF